MVENYFFPSNTHKHVTLLSVSYHEPNTHTHSTEEYFSLLPTYTFKQYASTMVAILDVIQIFSPTYFILHKQTALYNLSIIPSLILL
jgi:hypothetical protein